MIQELCKKDEGYGWQIGALCANGPENLHKIIAVDNPRSNEYIDNEREWRNWQTHWT